ncbi:MAG TPA: hypothetical protein VFS43_17300 [Polyangiaceae bacterium]|nr:hypothetical protein [Polyangiaceae bacterium]
MTKTPTRSVDRDGVVRVGPGAGGEGRRRLWPLLLALPALAGLLVLAAGGRDRRPPAPAAPTPAARAAEAPEAPPAARREPGPAVTTARAPDDDAEPDAGAPPDEPPAGPPPREGIHAFPPPGTKRIKAGLVVPEGFELPPGYMRHYQATDKGEMLQAILMFHPDYQPVDASGRPVPLPPDRVVPPELAPPGLALETLAVPADAYADPEKERADAEAEAEAGK